MKIKKTTTKKSVYIIDTSSLIFDPSCLTHFKGSTVVIPISVIQELDKHKVRDDQVGYSARMVNRKLYELKKQGDLNKGVLDKASGVTVKISKEVLEDLPHSLDRTIADDRILSVCFTFRKDRKNNVSLITNDLNLSLKAVPYGINSFEFEPKEKYTVTNYQGYREIEEDEDIIIEHIYKNFQIEAPKSLKAVENEFFLIKNKTTKQSVRCIHQSGMLIKLEDLNLPNLEERNNEQFYALSLLLDPEIKLVTLTGLAGSGKTIVSVAAGLAQALGKNSLYERMIISRSLVVLSGKDKIGFLKGDLSQKLQPYLLPLKDAIDQVIGKNSGGFDYLTATVGLDGKSIKPKIEIEPLQYIRGRSLRDCYFIVDEAQNLTLGEIKTVVSRMGENAKIILLGDLDQIDNAYVSKHTNGLTQVIEKFKGSKIAGHVTLTEGVRSELATEAAKRL